MSRRTSTALTPKQQQAYDYIRAFHADRSVGPTVREVGAHLGIKSSCSSQRHIEALIRKGYVTHVRYKYRSLRPVEALPTADVAAEAFEGIVDELQMDASLDVAWQRLFGPDAEFRIVYSYRDLKPTGAETPAETIARLRASLTQASAALTFYACHGDYARHDREGTGLSEIDRDGGNRARIALDAIRALTERPQ